MQEDIKTKYLKKIKEDERYKSLKENKTDLETIILYLKFGCYNNKCYTNDQISFILDIPIDEVIINLNHGLEKMDINFTYKKRLR